MLCRNNGSCIEVNITIANVDTLTYKCECDTDYTGTNCELVVDFCRNITCQNNGMCKTVNMTWKCFCLSDTLYYGEYCEHRTATLAIKQALTKSFSSVAITAITLTCSFVVLMDVLKYVFKIDPVKVERAKIQEKKAKPQSNVRPTVVRLQYIA